MSSITISGGTNNSSFNLSSNSATIQHQKSNGFTIFASDSSAVYTQAPDEVTIKGGHYMTVPGGTWQKADAVVTVSPDGPHQSTGVVVTGAGGAVLENLPVAPLTYGGVEGATP